jgi:hypothetical protein
MRVSGAIRHTVGAYIAGKMVAAAVRYAAITIGEFWQMRRPHSVILKAAVNKYDRFALSDFYVGKFSTVGGDPFNIISSGHRAHRAANDESNGCSCKIATRHTSCHLASSGKQSSVVV